MAYVLKTFYLNANDIQYLLDQVNFVPLFDSQGNAVVAWDGQSPVFNSFGNPIDLTGLSQQQAWDTYGHGFPQMSSSVGIRDVSGLHNNLFGTQADWGAVDLPFRRDVKADFSNYVPVNNGGSYFGTTPLHDLKPYTPGSQDASNIGHDYTTTVSSNGTVTQSDVVDYTPRMITRTVTTAGVNLLRDANNHYVSWDHLKYEAASDVLPLGATQAEIDAHDAAVAYKAMIDASGVDISKLVDGVKIVAPDGMSIAWDATANSASIQYVTLLNVIKGAGVLTDSTGGSLTDGENIFLSTDGGVTLNDTGIVFDANLFAYHSLVVASGATTSGLANGDPIAITQPQVDLAIAGLGTTAAVDPVSVDAMLTVSSGYGLLEQVGHIDFQQPDSGEFFVGSENPGVAPVNMWFGIFGQFFDHGLDLIGKGGQGTKIHIALSEDDPLYGSIGADGRPVYSIDISRATVAGADANGDPTYVNHTSPFIDQSQTYGSVDQITNLLREWVSTDGNATFHAGMEMFDGQTLVDAWERRLPDGTTEMVHNTLPSLSELRDHVLDTNRTGLTWEDVGNYRMRDGEGQVMLFDTVTGSPTFGQQLGYIDKAGVSHWLDEDNASTDFSTVAAKGSGHALILDMNPRFDAAHLDSTQAVGNTTVAALVDAAVATLNNSLAGSGMTFQQNTSGNIELIVTGGAGGPHMPDGTYTGASALAPWVNFADFSIMNPPPGPVGAAAIKDAVGQILMATVGDHYIAGDGRVNENFGLTSIHHVFHEEHNYQVENLKSWIYQHDNANSPGTHESLHQWQTDTGTMDAQGNFTYGVGGQIAWDEDKMFNATKLIVEMEYQHAAVDQYARTITPRIQEFVGYSTGVDPTISLEYSQVAFRFGHSTIRETIDTLDPNHWFFGTVTKYALERAFLNPQAFAEEGVAAITLGLSRAQMSEVDELITPALNQGLLGQPLDLAAINIARGRDLGIPDLNSMREGLSLARYGSWAEFGANMVHPESLVNFIAAYSFDGDVAAATAAMQNAAFMNNTYAGTNAALLAGQQGFEHIDAWLGGLAEAHVPGGLLGETFDAVFVAQIQALMDGDRFYYLYRLFGTNIHEEVNNGQFKDIVERNTGLSHLNGSIFAYADKYYDLGNGGYPSNEVLTDGTTTYYTDENGRLYTTRTGAGTTTDPYVYSGETSTMAQLKDAEGKVVNVDHDHAYGSQVASTGLGIHSDGGADMLTNHDIVTVTGRDFVRDPLMQNFINDVRPELDPTQVHTVEGTPTSGADSHEVLVGTDNADYIHARGGDDTVYGEGGNDFVYGDGGVDRLYGGNGDDMIDTGEGPDLADGGAGKDIIYGRGSGSEVGGFDQLVGGSGNDLIVGGEGIDKLSGGAGDDIIYGDGLTNPEMGNTDPFTHGGDGNDYMDGGASGDLLFGEEGDDYIVGGNDQDLIQGGQGDDIIKPGPQSQASGTNGGPDEVVGDNGVANTGFDIMDLSDWAPNAPGAVIDFSSQNNPLVAIDMTSPMPAWFQIEGAVGTRNGDTFIGSDVVDGAGDPDPFLGVNWLIGGSGNDSFSGGGGNDLIVGGSIRLDALVGRYDDSTSNTSLTLGSTAWLADAMQTGSGGSGYNNNTENSYTGASNRTGDADGLTSGGLLQGAGFDLHFTDMLQSRMFKDLVLGDGGTDGLADTVSFTGRMSQYSLVALNAQGQLVANPHANWSQVFAIKITDNRTDADFVDGNGDPIVDANGNALVNEGTDLIVGVERFQFADQTINVAGYFDVAPTLDLNVVMGYPLVTFASDNFNNNGGDAYSRGTSWNGSWTEGGDILASVASPDVSTTGAIRVSGNNNQRLEFRGSADLGSDNAGGATITRAINLNGVNAQRLNFNVDKNGIGNGETLQVQYSSDGTNFVTLKTFGNGSNGSDNGTGDFSIDISGQAQTATSAIRFVVTQLGNVTSNNNFDFFRVDNVVVQNFGTVLTDLSTGNGFSTSYTENGTGVSIAGAPVVGDVDDTLLHSASVRIRQNIAGDQLTVASGLPAGFTVSGSGTRSLTLTSVAGVTFTEMQDALKLVLFSSTSDNPGSNTRQVDVTVSDGARDSNVATTTVTVTQTNDAATAVTDNVITNIAINSNVAIADSALLANDSDPDSNMSISGIGGGTGGVVTTGSGAGHSGSTSTVRDTTIGGGAFTYTVNGVTGTANLSQDYSGNLDGTANSDILVDNGGANTVLAMAGNDFLYGNAGNDILNGGAGDDYIDAGNDNDTVIGGSGMDTLLGGSGLDILRGGSGVDSLTGGSGNDTFDYNSIRDSGVGAGNRDIIEDFQGDGATAGDVFDLSDIAGTFVWKGQAAFVSGSTFQVRFTQVNNQGNSNDYTVIQLDYDTDKGAEAEIHVKGLHNFTAADFIL